MFSSHVRVLHVITIIILICKLSASSPLKNKNSTLELVHILFRHGDRTTDRQTLYPKDPHINETYYPYGLGELTNEGKQREYKLGKTFRKIYGKFLDDLYTPDIVEAQSSDYNRTKMSLQLVLAGLFPPVKSLIWEPELNWQPIPYYTMPIPQDRLFYGFLCPNFQRLQRKFQTSPRFVKEMKQYEKLFRYLSENTGQNVTSFLEVFTIHACLKSEEEFGLELPEWTKNVYPQPLEQLTPKLYKHFTATTEMRRMASGYLLHKIFEDTQAKINKEPVRRNRKIYLYSGHETTIALLLRTLDVHYKEHIPAYGSYIAFELHKIDNVDGIKIYYHNSDEPERELLKLPACDEFCPFDQFVNLLEEYLPDENTCTAENLIKIKTD